MDILDISGLVTVGLRKDANSMIYFFETEPDAHPSHCARCGAVDDVLKSGTRKTTYRDIPIRGYRVIISVKANRFKCRTCGAIFAHQVPGIDPVRNMTARRAASIFEESLSHSFEYVAGQIGFEEGTVRRIFNEYVAEKSQEHRPNMPKFLSIDEISLNRRHCLIFADIEQQEVVDLLPDRENSTIVRWLLQFKGSSSPRVVLTDMSGNIRGAVQKVFPTVPVVVDKFHVLMLVNRAVERMKINFSKTLTLKQCKELMRSRTLLLKDGHKLSPEERINLDKLLLNDSNMATVYNLKEDFRSIFNLASQKEAAIALERWRESVPENIRGHFKHLLCAIESWKAEILANFDHPLTSTFSEVSNGVIKAVNLAGGYRSFDNIRARLLFGKLSKRKAPKKGSTTRDSDSK